MDNQSLKQLLYESPHPGLADALDRGQDFNFGKLLEEELRRSAFRLQRLKEYRNSLRSPMYRLHPEILARIFFIYARDNGELFNLRWTRILFVCRRWHDVSMHTLSLWSFIDVSGGLGGFPGMPDGLDEHDARDIRRIEYQRSRAALSPLTVKMSIHPHSSLSAAKLAYISMFWNSSSLASLNVTADKVHIDRILRVLASHRHSILGDLTLHHGPSLFVENTVLQQFPLTLAPRENLPQLRNLFIADVLLDWLSVRGLQSLRVTYRSRLPIGVFALEQLVGALSRCPQLETLVIKLPTNFYPQVPSNMPRALSLPRLEVAILEGAQGLCSPLLQALSDIPYSTRLIVSTSEDPSLPEVSFLLGAHASRQCLSVIRSVVISLQRMQRGPGAFEQVDDDEPSFASRIACVGQRSFNRRNILETLLHWTEIIEEDETSYIGLETMTMTVREVQTLKDMIQHWPLATTTHIDLRLALEINPGHLCTLSAALPAATTIIVRPESDAAKVLCDYLRTLLREHQRRVFTNIIFDASEVNDRPGFVGWDGAVRLSLGVHARVNVMRMLLYGTEAASADMPLDTIGIINEPQERNHKLLDITKDFDWRELRANLREGFVYDGVLYSEAASSGCRAWDV